MIGAHGESYPKRPEGGLPREAGAVESMGSMKVNSEEEYDDEEGEDDTSRERAFLY